MTEPVRNGQTTSTKEGKTDPTALTTDALMREVEILNKDLDRRFGFYDRLLEAADRQRLEQKGDTAKAVDAALAAAKEAVKEQNLATKEAIGKSETLFYSTLDQLKTDVGDLKKFRDNAGGRQTALIVGMAVIYGGFALGLRFLG